MRPPPSLYLKEITNKFVGENKERVSAPFVVVVVWRYRLVLYLSTLLLRKLLIGSVLVSIERKKRVIMANKLVYVYLDHVQEGKEGWNR